MQDTPCRANSVEHNAKWYLRTPLIHHAQQKTINFQGNYKEKLLLASKGKKP
jgi:hypothetical protein